MSRRTPEFDLVQLLRDALILLSKDLHTQAWYAYRSIHNIEPSETAPTFAVQLAHDHVRSPLFDAVHADGVRCFMERVFFNNTRKQTIHYSDDAANHNGFDLMDQNGYSSTETYACIYALAKFLVARFPKNGPKIDITHITPIKQGTHEDDAFLELEFTYVEEGTLVKTMMLVLRAQPKIGLPERFHEGDYSFRQSEDVVAAHEDSTPRFVFEVTTFPLPVQSAYPDVALEPFQRDMIAHTVILFQPNDDAATPSTSAVSANGAALFQPITDELLTDMITELQDRGIAVEVYDSIDAAYQRYTDCLAQNSEFGVVLLPVTAETQAFLQERADDDDIAHVAPTVVVVDPVEAVGEHTHAVMEALGFRSRHAGGVTQACLYLDRLEDPLPAFIARLEKLHAQFQAVNSYFHGAHVRDAGGVYPDDDIKIMKRLIAATNRLIPKNGSGPLLRFTRIVKGLNKKRIQIRAAVEAGDEVPELQVRYHEQLGYYFELEVQLRAELSAFNHNLAAAHGQLTQFKTLLTAMVHIFMGESFEGELTPDEARRLDLLLTHLISDPDTLESLESILADMSYLYLFNFPPTTMMLFDADQRKPRVRKRQTVVDGLANTTESTSSANIFAGEAAERVAAKEVKLHFPAARKICTTVEATEAHKQMLAEAGSPFVAGTSVRPVDLALVCALSPVARRCLAVDALPDVSAGAATASSSGVDSPPEYPGP